MPRVFGETPRTGDRILILQEHWLECILEQRKFLEIRGRRLKTGDAWLGCAGNVFGKVRLGVAFRIKNLRDFQSLESMHLVPATDSLPYKKTWAMPLEDVESLSEPIPFERRRGAIGIAKFREIRAP